MVVPTYNERGVVAETLRRVDDALAATGRDYELVVVDDDSLDGTVEVVGEASAALPVRALRRRGNAVSRRRWWTVSRTGATTSWS